LKTTITTIGLSALLACTTLSAQESPLPSTVRESITQRFKQYDKNGDGKLTHDEVLEMLPFDEWDANKDGVVTLDEVLSYYAKPRTPGRTTATGRPAAKSATKPPRAVSPRRSSDDFVPDAPFVGEVNGSYIDPEFSESASQVVFQDMQNRVWVGDLNPETGLFKTATGRDYLMDENITLIFDRPPQGRKFSTNGPEWTRDEKGHCVVYTKVDQEGVMQQWMARLVNGKSAVTQMTHNKFDCYGNMPSRFQDSKPPRIAYTYDWPIWKAKAAWIFFDKPAEPHQLEGFDYRQMSMWSAVSPDFLFVKRTPGAPHGQIARANADTGKVTVLTNDEGQKDDPGLFVSPEFGGEILLVCNVDNSALGIYRDLKSPDGFWTRIATLKLPDDAPHKFISSPETIASATGVGGVSYFSLLAREGKDRNTPGSIWVLGLGKDEKNRFVRRVDHAAGTSTPTVVLEPEPFVGKNEVYVYYNFFDRASGQHGVRRASTGIKVAVPRPGEGQTKAGPARAAAADGKPVKQDFTVDDVPLTLPGSAFSDPEFNDEQRRVTYWDYSEPGNVRVYVGELDPNTGLFKRPPGRDYVLADHVSPFFKDGQWWAHNGPEWGCDKNGWAVYFTKEDRSRVRQLWRATLSGGRYEVRQLTTLPGGACGGLYTQHADDVNTGLMFYLPKQDTVAWAAASTPNEFHELPGFKHFRSISHWVPGTKRIAYVRAVGSPASPQLVYLDTRTGEVHQVSDEPGDKFDPWGFRAPEFGGETLMMCVINRQQIAIYRDVAKDGKPWNRVATPNGDLYMAARITTDASGQPVDGGLYRRIDGPKPAWELVHRWPIDKEILQSRFLRGLTAVPNPRGGSGEVLIANFEYPGLIVRFDPTRTEVVAEQELDIKEFFNQAWNTPSAHRRGAIAAYNRFLPVIDPKSGETVWLCGGWVERPDPKNPPNNGSVYLIRHRDGRYDWGYIYDAAHPVPAGQKLTGCRDIEPSPFPGERGRVFYFCGYDGGAGPRAATTPNSAKTAPRTMANG